MQILLPLATFLMVLTYVWAGVVFFLVIERKLSALIQHRDGQLISAKMLFSSLFFSGDSKRIALKDEFPTIRSIFYFWMSLPIGFLFLLFSGNQLGGVLSSFPALFLVAGFSLVIEVIFLHYCLDELEREGWRSRLFFRFVGLFALGVTFWVVAFHAGGISLRQIVGWQQRHLLPLFLSSPGALLSAIVAFLSISVLARVDLQDQDRANHLRGRWQQLIFLNKRIWVISLLSLWVFCFWGGGGGLIALLFFPIKVIFLSLLLIMIQISLPNIRATDLTESFFSIFLKLAMLGILLEIIWMGVSP